MKIKGYVSKSELSWYKEADIEKDNNSTPFILSVWKDKSDFRYCEKGIHLQEITINA